ncbi:IDEAL domain-containing protein [Bacillus sp. REN3]|uniref:IDEAL domain-containing protein n=1 Tax=Bacillus sp. REN3 TaxID=2802440 RepID=UPI001AEE1A8E|nr:IDEAL domain-containing protein [Bacillus sp. REN3]
MLDEKPILKRGDWVKTKLKEGELILGYIESLDIINGLVNINVVTSDIDEVVGQTVVIGLKYVEGIPAAKVKNKEQIRFLIDLALMTGDEEWFLELSSKLKSMEELVSGAK